MCYLLRSCDDVFLWQHTIQCYSYFAVLSFAAEIVLVLLAQYKRLKGVNCRKGGNSQVSQVPAIFLYGYLSCFPSFL